MRIVVLLAGQTNGLQHLRNQRFDGGAACADHFESERHVLPYRLVVQQLVVLEDEADGTTVVRNLPCRQSSQIVARHADLAVSGLLLAQQQAQQRCFAGTGRAHEKDEVVSIDFETDVIQCRARALRIDFAHMFERDQRHREVPYSSASSAAARRCS